MRYSNITIGYFQHYTQDKCKASNSVAITYNPSSRDYNPEQVFSRVLWVGPNVYKTRRRLQELNNGTAQVTEADRDSGGEK